MTIADLLRDATRRLAGRPSCTDDPPSPRLDAEVLLSHVLNKDRAWLLAHDDEPVSPFAERDFQKLIERRMAHEPVAHLVGHKAFMGLELKTNRHVLIPRPETELLVEAAIAWIRESDPGRTFFWDVGTGSGAIAASLATAFPGLAGLATDVSATALHVAEENFETLRLTHRVRTLKADLLDPGVYAILRDAARQTDRLAIAANLPYLAETDRGTMMPDVVDFEPERALFARENGLAVIRRFVGQLRRHLAEWGFRDAFLLFEYDPPQTPKICALLDTLKESAAEYRLDIHRDLAGRERFATLELRGIVRQAPRHQPPTTSS